MKQFLAAMFAGLALAAVFAAPAEASPRKTCRVMESHTVAQLPRWGAHYQAVKCVPLHGTAYSYNRIVRY